MTKFNVQVGQKVKIVRTESSWLNAATWWPVGDITGTVDAVYKNGKVSVACDQLKNTSADGKLSKIFKQDDVTITAI